ncbi:NAD kinase b isoform X2 [Corythoichthys intestinalis]|uniref:NAD kinase b isoform X2 n=1 Tax=Corythoichthys intestinalis TaxID=161448 RepID=UPI0025A55648|nr:NAD kinase b isoform X2 [Corythoichthys intestinalis]
MDNSEGGTSSEPESGTPRPSSRQPSRFSEHGEPGLRRETKQQRRRQQRRRRGDGQEQLLRETARQRLPGQREHSEACGSVSDAAESSPKRRAHFLHGPYPATNFGPKACILPNPTSVMHIQDPASQRLTWNKPPVNVLVIRKIRDESLVEPFKDLCRFLVEEKQMMVYVERRVADDGTLSKDENFGSIRNQLCTFREGNAAITLRSRLKVKVVKEMFERTAAAQLQRQGQDGEQEHNGLVPHRYISSEAGKVTLQLQVLNEVVVDRGPSSYLSNVDLYLDGRLITSVQGDGVIVSTPTGSTAYAAAAGASMIHPNVPAIMVTPICPHSLSFRPIVVPAGVELMITLSPDARNTAWVSFDGRKRQEIQHGDCIKITTSCFPVPSICCHDLVYDWFESLAQCLHWNVRKRQTRLADASDTEN